MQQMIGRVGVDGGVAGHHADVLGAEGLAEVEELLRHQRLDRCGVEAAPPLRDAKNCAPAATRLLPDPVGVLRITFAPETSSISASSCVG